MRRLKTAQYKMIEQTKPFVDQVLQFQIPQAIADSDKEQALNYRLRDGSELRQIDEAELTKAMNEIQKTHAAWKKMQSKLQDKLQDKLQNSGR